MRETLAAAAAKTSNVARTAPYREREKKTAECAGMHTNLEALVIAVATSRKLIYSNSIFVVFLCALQ